MSEADRFADGCVERLGAVPDRRVDDHKFFSSQQSHFYMQSFRSRVKRLYKRFVLNAF
jgi:hypothetical protein